MCLSCIAPAVSCVGGDDLGYDARPITTTCQGPNIPPAYAVVNAFEGVTVPQPSDVTQVSDGVFYVVSQLGTISSVSRSGKGWKSKVVLDLSSKLAPYHVEGGLLSIALAPDFATSRFVYVSYTGKSSTSLFRTVVSRFKVDGDAIDPSSEALIFTLERTAQGHNGGKLRFGPDGYLYIAVGDGHPLEILVLAQDPNEYFGKMLRIDVGGRLPGTPVPATLDVPGQVYRVPADNPFAKGGGRPEVFALGFRNPWSFSFDPQNRLWVGDVGNERYEELDLVVNGGNYGWPFKEGNHCIIGTCEGTSFIPPVVEYPHVNGFAVMAGFVYRGKSEALRGKFVFADFISGRVWTVDGNSPSLDEAPALLMDTGMNVSGLAEDKDGELLLLDYAGGRVLRIEPGTPRTLRGTTLRSLGCLEGQTNEMTHTLVPYDVNAPLWSDGASKRRWISVPTDKQIHVRPEDGAFELPYGTMLMKEFAQGGKRIETRMMIRDDEYDWLFYTFQWNAAGTDAELVEEGREVKTAEGGTWSIPSRGQCLSCHVADTKRVLGFEVAQINRLIRYPNGRIANQVTTLSQLGYFDRPIDANAVKPIPNPYGTNGTDESRARAFLHSNCANCHGPLAGFGGFNLRTWGTVESMGVLCRKPSGSDFGIPGAQIIVPGEPGRSLIVQRMKHVGSGQMPPLGRTKVDEAAVEVVSRWISGLPKVCPPPVGAPYP